MNLSKDFIFYIIYFSILFLTISIYFINKLILKHLIIKNKFIIDRVGVTTNELKITTAETKKDYKYFVHFVVSLFFLGIPLILFYLNENYRAIIDEL